MVARVKTRVKFAGFGAFVQLVGVLTLILCGVFLGVIGLILGGVLGIVLFLVGSSMSKYHCCSACGNRVDGYHVKICAVCHAQFGVQQEADSSGDSVVPEQPNAIKDILIFVIAAASLCAVILVYNKLF